MKLTHRPLTPPTPAPPPLTVRPRIRASSAPSSPLPSVRAAAPDRGALQVRGDRHDPAAPRAGASLALALGQEVGPPAPADELRARRPRPLRATADGQSVVSVRMPRPSASADEARNVRYPHLGEDRLAFTYAGDIWTSDLHGHNVCRITAHPSRDFGARISPDGKLIAFSSYRTGNSDVFVVPVDGGEPVQLTFHSSDDIVRGWTPDSKRVLIQSDRDSLFQPGLYTVGLDGSMPEPLPVKGARYASFSPDGKKLVFAAGGESYSRKGYRGANHSNLWVLDLERGGYTQLTRHDGTDTWPMWGKDRQIYFASDRGPSGTMNIWRVPDAGGDPVPVTRFTDGDLRWPSMGNSGREIVFERDFSAQHLDLTTGEARPYHLAIKSDARTFAPSKVRKFDSVLDEFSVAPSGKRIVLAVHGEIFNAPVEDGLIRQLTDSPSRDQHPLYSPDGAHIAFVSDRSGKEQIYVTASDGRAEPRAITDSDTMKSGLAWSPDSRRVAWVDVEQRLHLTDVESSRDAVLAKSLFRIGQPAFSPDGQWIAFAHDVSEAQSEIRMVPADGGTPRPITFGGFRDGSPKFSPDGRAIFFLRSDGNTQLWRVDLERQTSDPEEPADPEDAAPSRASRGAAPGRAREVEVDFEGMRRRARRLTAVPAGVDCYAVSPDGRGLAYVTSEFRLSEREVIRAIDGEGDQARTLEESRGGNIANLEISRDGRRLFWREGARAYHTGMPSLGTGQPGHEGRSAIAFVAPVKIDAHAERLQIFDEAWRVLKHVYYDASMHGRDWAALRDKYRPMVAHVADAEEFDILIGEMLGELNSSHLGISRLTPWSESSVKTVELGLELEPDPKAGRYRVAHIFKDGPADKDWVRVKPGDYLIAIDGHEVRQGDDYYRLLQDPLNGQVELRLSDDPTGKSGWGTRIRSITAGQQQHLRYERWVESRRAKVDAWGEGRVGYLHIEAMNQRSLQRFRRELRNAGSKEALIIDVRFNPGGNIDQELVRLLAPQPYVVRRQRAGGEYPHPAGGFYGPKVLLQNEHSGSNSEILAAAFRKLGLGKIVGTPTSGAVIGTTSWGLMDGSSLRTPISGCYLKDAKATNLENYGVPPDIFVEHTPEDDQLDRDRQLDRAVQELLAQLPPRPASRAK